MNTQPPPKPGPYREPDLDATSGVSYEQANQTPGALGGRRAVQRWFSKTVPTRDCT